MRFLAWLFAPSLPEQIDTAALIRALKVQGWKPKEARPSEKTVKEYL